MTVGIGLWIVRPTAVLTPVSSTDSVHYRCLAAVQTRLQSASFPAAKDPEGGDDIPLLLSSIVVKKLPLERIYRRATQPLALPCVLITPQRAGAVPTAGTNEHDDYTKPVLVTMILPDNEEPTLQLNLDVISLWQERVMRAFHNQRLPGVSEVLIGYAEPAESVIPVGWGHNVLASAVLLKFVCRETRGLS